MKLLKELLETSVSKTTAQKVYHRDYVKTKNKKYRKYHPKKVNKKSSVKESVEDTEHTFEHPMSNQILRVLSHDGHAWTEFKGALMMEDKEEAVKRLAMFVHEKIPNIKMADLMAATHDIVDTFWGMDL